MTIKTYAISRNEKIEWDIFVEHNDWVVKALENKIWDDEEIPRKCKAIYYVVNKNEKQIKSKLYITTYDPEYKEDFKTLNIKWIERIFKVEQSDIKQLCYPEESIIQPGGELFFLIEKNKVIGTVAMVVKDGKCELGKLTVDDQHQSKGFSHPLMIEGIQWAKEKGYPEVLILTSTILEGALKLYKNYGFETIHLGKHPDYERCDIVLKLSF